MKKTKFRLVLMRHGHTTWNLTNRFTGWSDVPLSDVGLSEAKKAGIQLSSKGYDFDEAHVSALKRTRQALDAVLRSANHSKIPVHTSWRLNERHYGGLQGLNKQEIFSAWGEQQSYLWWRGYHDQPPPLAIDDPTHPRFDPLYKDVDETLLPHSESLSNCLERVLPYWLETLLPKIHAGKRLLVVSHGNTLRSLRLHIEKMSYKEIEKIEIPLGVPFVYHFDDNMTPEHIEWLD